MLQICTKFFGTSAVNRYRPDTGSGKRATLVKSPHFYEHGRLHIRSLNAYQNQSAR